MSIRKSRIMTLFSVVLLILTNFSGYSHVIQVLAVDNQVENSQILTESLDTEDVGSIESDSHSVESEASSHSHTSESSDESQTNDTTQQSDTTQPSSTSYSSLETNHSDESQDESESMVQSSNDTQSESTKSDSKSETDESQIDKNEDETDSTEPTYVLATDEDFVFVPYVQGQYFINGVRGHYRYIGTDEYVEIPDTIQGWKVTSWYKLFSGRQNTLKGVKGVKGNSNGVSSMSGMFEGATFDSGLDLRQLDTSNIVNMMSVFSGTTINGELNLSNFDTKNVTNMPWMFYNTKIDFIDTRSFDTRKVTNFSYMFYRTTAKEIDITNLRTDKALHLHYMFSYIQDTEIDISHFNTPLVQNMSSMFEGSAVEHIDISMLNTSRTSNMSAMFRDAKAKTINVAGIDTKNVTTMEGMFEGVTLPSINLTGFNTSKVTTMSRMFQNANIPNLDLRPFNTSKVKIMTNMFRGFKQPNVNLSSFNTSRVTLMNHMFRDAAIQTLDLSHFDTSRLLSANSMFMNSKAHTIDISNFNTIRLTDMSHMFDSSSATTIHLGKFDTSYVMNMSAMFRNTKITTVDLSQFDMKSVNNTDNMFQGSSIRSGQSRASQDTKKLNESTNKPSGLNFIPKYTFALDSEFSGNKDGEFKYIGNADYVELPNGINGIPITSYKNMFEGTVVQGVISTNRDIVDMSGMFRNNKSQDLDVSTLTTSKVVDMSHMFEGTIAKELDLRKFETESLVNMSAMFKNTQLEEIDLGSFNLDNVINTNDALSQTTAKVGYARTQTDLTKLNASRNKPSDLTFTIWSITTTQVQNEWTNSHVDIAIKGVSDTVGIDFVEMINEPGRNLIPNSERELGHGHKSEFMQIADLAPIFDKYGTDQTYTLSLDLKTQDTTNARRFNVYMQNGTTSKYSFVNQSVNVTGEYQRFEFKGLQPKISYAGDTKAMLAVYGTYDTGNYPMVKNVKLELGDQASEWTPAPEDNEQVSDQGDIFTVYNSGTYVFRATDLEDNTRTVAHTITNIDKDNPSIKILGSPETWTPGPIVLDIEGGDTTSGVKQITLPNNDIVTSSRAEYIVEENDEYEFIVEDLAGNTTHITEVVENIGHFITVNHIAETPQGQYVIKSEELQTRVGDTLTVPVLTDDADLLDTEGKIRYGYSQHYQLNNKDRQQGDTVSVVIPDKHTDDLTVYYKPIERQVTVNHQEIEGTEDDNGKIQLNGQDGDILMSESQWVDINNERYTAFNDLDKRLGEGYRFVGQYSQDKGQTMNALDGLNKDVIVDTTDYSQTTFTFYYGVPVTCSPEYTQVINEETGYVECHNTLNRTHNPLNLYYNTYLQKPEGSQFNEALQSQAIYNFNGYVQDTKDYYAVTGVQTLLTNGYTDDTMLSTNDTLDVYLSGGLKDFNVVEELGLDTTIKGYISNVDTIQYVDEELDITERDVDLDMATWSNNLAATTQIPTEMLTQTQEDITHKIRSEFIQSIKHVYEPILVHNGFVYGGVYRGTELIEDDRDLVISEYVLPNVYQLSYGKTKDSYQNKGHLVGQEVHNQGEDTDTRNYFEYIRLNNIPHNEPKQVQTETQQGINISEVLNYTNELDDIDLPYVGTQTQLTSEDKQLQFNRNEMYYLVSAVDDESQGLSQANIKEDLGSEQLNTLSKVTESSPFNDTEYQEMEPLHIYQLDYDRHTNYSEGIQAMGITTDQVFSVGRDSGLQVALDIKEDRDTGKEMLDTSIESLSSQTKGLEIVDEDSYNEYQHLLNQQGIEGMSNTDRLITNGDGSNYYIPINQGISKGINNRMVLGQVGLNDFTVVRDDNIVVSKHLYGTGNESIYTPQRQEIDAGERINIGNVYTVLDKDVQDSYKDMLHGLKQGNLHGTRMMYSQQLDTLFKTTHSIQ